MLNTRDALTRNNLILLLALMAVLLTGWPAFKEWLSSEPQRLRVESVYFRDGFFFQTITPVGATLIQGQWSASIFTTGGRFVCGGGGNGSYSGNLVTFSPDDWTGDDCSTLKIGSTYVARASWSNLDQFGHTHSSGTEFEFVYDV